MYSGKLRLFTCGIYFPCVYIEQSNKSKTFAFNRTEISFQIDSLLFSLTLSNNNTNPLEHFKKILSHSIRKPVLKDM